MDPNTFQQIQSSAGLSAVVVNSKPLQIIASGLPYVFGAAGIILILNIITSGIKMMTSAGEPKALGAAQAKLTTSAIGILILFTSFWIVQLVMKFLGVNTILFIN